MREQKAKDILLLHRLNEKPGKGMVAWLKSVIAVGSSGIAFLCIERLFLPRDRNVLRKLQSGSRMGGAGSLCSASDCSPRLQPRTLVHSVRKRSGYLR